MFRLILSTDKKKLQYHSPDMCVEYKMFHKTPDLDDATECFITLVIQLIVQQEDNDQICIICEHLKNRNTRSTLYSLFSFRLIAWEIYIGIRVHHFEHFLIIIEIIVKYAE